MRQAIEQGGRQLLVAGKDGDPFGEGEIRGDDRGAPLIAVGQQIEEQLADAVEGEAQLVDNQDVEAQQPLLEARELPLVAASTSWRTRSAARVKRTRRFCFVASTPSAIAKCVLPVPMGPAKIRFSGAVTHSPRASVWTWVALTPSAAAKSNVSRS